MRAIRILCLLVTPALLLGGPPVVFAGGTFVTSVQNGDWNTASTWDKGAPPDAGLGEQVNIAHVVTVQSPGANANVLNIGQPSAGTLVLSSQNVVVPNSVTIHGAGTLRLRPSANGAAGLGQIQALFVAYVGASPTLELDVADYTPSLGDAWSFATISGGSVSGTPNLVAPAGYTIVEDRSVPGVLTLRVTGVPASVPGAHPLLLIPLLSLAGAARVVTSPSARCRR